MLSKLVVILSTRVTE